MNRLRRAGLEDTVTPTAADQRRPSRWRPHATAFAAADEPHRRHWDTVYQGRAADEVGWYQAEPRMSLELIHELGIEPTAAVIDVGGGTSFLVDRLVKAGFTDLTVLDVSVTALTLARRRLPYAADVTWLHADLLNWRAGRRYRLWHDRAVFHFLTEDTERARYLATLRTALEPGGHLILATFAADGPDRCSGLPVIRYSADDLRALLADHFQITRQHSERHITPGGAVQPYTWVAAQPHPLPP